MSEPEQGERVRRMVHVVAAGCGTASGMRWGYQEKVAGGQIPDLAKSTGPTRRAASNP